MKGTIPERVITRSEFCCNRWCCRSICRTRSRRIWKYGERSIWKITFGVKDHFKVGSGRVNGLVISSLYHCWNFKNRNVLLMSIFKCEIFVPMLTNVRKRRTLKNNTLAESFIHVDLVEFNEKRYFLVSIDTNLVTNLILRVVHTIIVYSTYSKRRSFIWNYFQPEIKNIEEVLNSSRQYYVTWWPETWCSLFPGCLSKNAAVLGPWKHSSSSTWYHYLVSRLMNQYNGAHSKLSTSHVYTPIHHCIYKRK